MRATLFAAALLCVSPAMAQTPNFGQLAPASMSAAAVRKIILAQRSRLFKDPASIREASIGQPYACRAGGGDCVCVELNARNSYGGYTGLKTIGVWIHNGQAEAFGEMKRLDDCGKMNRFNELNGR
jgi:hypothetical protein